MSFKEPESIEELSSWIASEYKRAGKTRDNDLLNFRRRKLNRLIMNRDRPLPPNCDWGVEIPKFKKGEGESVVEIEEGRVTRAYVGLGMTNPINGAFEGENRS